MPPSVREATYCTLLAKEVYERTVERTVRQLFMYCTALALLTLANLLPLNNISTVCMCVGFGAFNIQRNGEALSRTTYM